VTLSAMPSEKTAAAPAAGRDAAHRHLGPDLEAAIDLDAHRISCARSAYSPTRTEAPSARWQRNVAAVVDPGAMHALARVTRDDFLRDRPATAAIGVM